MNMKFPDMSFDLVLHSDVLEHIKYPIRGLSECYRILKPGGYCAFTIPMIVDRLTISREGMPPSYHGSSDNLSDDLIVHTEYGCDSWRQVIQAGFQQCRLFSIDYPSSLALVAVK
jgi:ubiquinone/menaquinone biosynthesis C-methylase UbiE